MGVYKMFPLMVQTSEEDNTQKPYIARIHVTLAFQNLLITGQVGGHEALMEQIKAMYEELKRTVS